MRVIETFTHPGPVDEIALSPDGRLVAAAGNGVFAVLGLTDARRVWEAPFPPVAQLAFSPDGTWMAAGYRDRLRNQVRAGPVERPEQPRSWRVVESESGFGGGVAFDPDGRHLLVTQIVPPPAYTYDPRPRGRLDRLTIPGGQLLP